MSVETLSRAPTLPESDHRSDDADAIASLEARIGGALYGEEFAKTGDIDAEYAELMAKEADVTNPAGTMTTDLSEALLENSEPVELTPELKMEGDKPRPDEDAPKDELDSEEEKDKDDASTVALLPATATAPTPTAAPAPATTTPLAPTPTATPTIPAPAAPTATPPAPTTGAPATGSPATPTPPAGTPPGGGGNRPNRPTTPNAPPPDPRQVAASDRYEQAKNDYARHAAGKASRLFSFPKARREYREAQEELNSSIRALAHYDCQDILLNRTPAPTNTVNGVTTIGQPGAPGSANLTSTEQSAEITKYLLKKYDETRKNVIDNLAKDEVKGIWRKSMEALQTNKGKVFLALGVIASSLAIAGTFGGGAILAGAIFTGVRVTASRTTRALPTENNGGPIHELLPGQASIDARHAANAAAVHGQTHRGTHALLAASENLMKQLDKSVKRERNDRYRVSLGLGILAGAGTFSVGHAFAAFAHQQAFGGSGTIRGAFEQGGYQTYVPTHGESIPQMFGGHFLNIR